MSEKGQRGKGVGQIENNSLCKPGKKKQNSKTVESCSNSDLQDQFCPA